jgi:hypothetical protein
MDGEHDTDTYSPKKVQPHIFYESAETLAHELAEDTSCGRQRKRKRECEGHNNYTLYYKTSRPSICIIPIMEENNSL